MSLTKNQRTQLISLFCLHLLWGFVLWWSVSSHGLGTSRDSVEYLFTGKSLADGNGFISFSGEPFIYWPPLYPILLSLPLLAGVSSPLMAALFLQLITFVLISAFCIWLFHQLFPDNFVLIVMGSMAVTTSVVLTMLFQTVGSDYLFLALVLVFVYVCDLYIKEGGVVALWMMIIIAALAMLQRYIGVSLFVTGIWIIFFYSQVNLKEKIIRLAQYGLSVLPLCIWALSLPREALVRGAPSSLFENIYWFTFSVLSWFVPASELYDHPARAQLGIWGVWLFVFVGSFLLWKHYKERSTVGRTHIPLFLFGVIYTVTLFAVASLSSFNTLDGRFASPVLIPLVVFIMMAMSMAFQEMKNVENMLVGGLVKVILFLLTFFIFALSGRQSLMFIQSHHEFGWGYTSAEWNDHPIIKYWRENLPSHEYISFSNYPAGVSVQTWIETMESPRRTRFPNAGEEVIPLETYTPYVIIPGLESYLVWVEPNAYTHVYTVEDLREIAEVVTLYENESGGIYRLLPR